jgi:hypothetical protein
MKAYVGFKSIVTGETNKSKSCEVTKSETNLSAH